MKLPGNHGPVRPEGQAHTSRGSGNGRSAVVGNERLTALAGAVLLVLLLVELVSSASLHALLPRLASHHDARFVCPQELVSR